MNQLHAEQNEMQPMSSVAQPPLGWKLKRTLITRHIGNYQISEALNNAYLPKAGDVAMFEVIECGKHWSVQGHENRNVAIFPGDRILASFADRYATSQFEGYVPDTFYEVYHILGAGGAVGIVKSKNDSLKDVEPTTLKLIGYATDAAGQVINTKFYHTGRKHFRGDTGGAKVILSVGATMDSGKTTTAASLCRGLKISGKTIAFIKLTGTCYTKDKDFVLDCGADITIDFSDVGYPSTFMCSLNDILDIYQSLLDELARHKPDYIVMEIADGLMQRETAFLLRSKIFMNTIHKVIFSCGDSLSAFHGIEILSGLGIKPAAVSGRFTMSPLLIQEVKDHSGIEPLHIDQLMSGQFNELFF